MATALSKPLNNIHHAAYRCRDAEQTRWFWEDIMGFPAKMALKFDTDPATGVPYEYVHMFFLMGDGNLIAFFDAPDDASEDKFDAKEGYDLHVAFEVDSHEELQEWNKHFTEMGLPCSPVVEHGFVDSVYLYDPNGIQVEVTVKTDRYDTVIAEEESQLKDILAEWTASTREKKEKIFGAKKLDMRQEICAENIMAVVKKSMSKAEPEHAE